MSKILFVCGYFDWFSGYQETALAAALSADHEVHVLAGDRVNPIFSDLHLQRSGVSRRYVEGKSYENGVHVHRILTKELRSMLWARSVNKIVDTISPDVIIQVMPGQLLPALATKNRNGVPRGVLYGDNSAMWAELTPFQSRIKWLVFSLTKGQLYKVVNRRASAIFGYTPETVFRLSAFSSGREMKVLPLTFHPDTFFFSEALRDDTRRELSIAEDEIAVLVPGKIQKQKRLDIVGQAISRLIEDGHRIKLVIAGNDSSSLANDIINVVKSYDGLRDRVVTTGFLSPGELNRVFNACDVGVWPKMPAITIQQAMGTGLYCILPKNDYVGHLLREGSGRYIGENLDLVEQIADSIRDYQLIDDERAHRADVNSWLSSSRVAHNMIVNVTERSQR